MAQEHINSAHEEIAKLDAMQVTQISELPFEFLNKPENKTIKLVANSGETKPIKGKNVQYNYEFSAPVFVTKFRVQTSNYSKANDFNFEWSTVEGSTQTARIEMNENGIYEIEISSLITCVSFTPPTKWYSEPTLHSVTIEGIPSSGLPSFLEEISKINQFKSRVRNYCQKSIDEAQEKQNTIDSLNSGISAIKSEISDLQNKKAELEGAIGRLQGEHATTQNELESRKQRLSELDDTIDKKSQEVSKSNKALEQTKSSLADAQQELKDLQNDKNLFPTEIREFVNQGAQNIRSYWIYAAAPLLLLFASAYQLHQNATNLSSIPYDGSLTAVFAAMITRTPYVVIMVAIIVASYSIAHFMISEVIRINQQRLNLAKISIIAKEVIDSSKSKLNELSDEEILAARTSLKMEMLRDHMKTYLSSEFNADTKSFSFAAIRKLVSSSVSGKEEEADSSKDEKVSAEKSRDD